MELLHEYWREKTLLDIASVVGTPLALDASTKNRVFGNMHLFWWVWIYQNTSSG